MGDINREVSIEQIDYNVDIEEANYTIEINPPSKYIVELNEQGPQGARGYAGNGISSYELTSTVGLTDTYTITFTDGNTTTVEVTNGRGITSITGPVSVGNVDTYTINYNDNTTSTFNVINGIDGVNPTVTVGTTTTGNPGTNASVVNSGTTQDIVLDFTIPRGDKGETGEDGNDGFSPIATVNKVGDTATISITDINGTTTTTISDGIDGTDGTDGQAATITVGTVTTGLPTDAASVTNVGTSSAAIFNFTIPKGDTGNTGATGNGIINTEYISSSGLVDTYHINYTNGNHDTFTVTNGQNGTGSVTDVLVNGSSVLDGDIAKINLTNYATLNSLQTFISNKIFNSELVLQGTHGIRYLNSNQTNTLILQKTNNVVGSGYIQIGNTSDDIKLIGKSTTTRPQYNSNDLALYSDIPTVPTTDQTYDGISSNPQSGIAIAGAKFIQNTATGTGSITIGGTANSNNYGVNIGTFSGASGAFATAIGAQAEANAEAAIQIGSGTNSNAATMAIGFEYNGNVYHYKLLEGTTGLIPDARISTNIARSTDIPTIDQTFDKTSANAQSGASILGLLEVIYPVGSLYMSTNATCPLADMFGTWTLVAQDKALWTGDGTNGDTTIAAGLPNITGTMQSGGLAGNTWDCIVNTTSGAFTKTGASSYASKGTNVSAGSYYIAAQFTASNSNSIYGNSSTVQPPAYVVNVWKRTA